MANNVAASNEIQEKTKKAPAASAVNKKNAKHSNGKPKKKGHKGLVMTLIVSLILIVAAVSYILNVGQLKDRITGVFLQKQNAAQADVNADNLKLLKTKQTQLDQKQAELNQEESDLHTKEKQLNDLQQQLSGLKDELNGQKKEYQTIAKIYETMDSEAAAKILSKYTDKNEISQILMQLSNAKSAEILSNMDPELASQILKLTK